MSFKVRQTNIVFTCVFSLRSFAKLALLEVKRIRSSRNAKMAYSNLISRGTMEAIKSAKSALRKDIQAALRKISKEEKERQSTKVKQKVSKMCSFCRCRAYV